MQMEEGVDSCICRKCCYLLIGSLKTSFFSLSPARPTFWLLACSISLVWQKLDTSLDKAFCSWAHLQTVSPHIKPIPTSSCPSWPPTWSGCCSDNPIHFIQSLPLISLALLKFHSNLSSLHKHVNDYWSLPHVRDMARCSSDLALSWEPRNKTEDRQAEWELHLLHPRTQFHYIMVRGEWTLDGSLQRECELAETTFCLSYSPVSCLVQNMTHSDDFWKYRNTKRK